MALKYNEAFIHIAEHKHRLPGIGLIKYHFIQDVPELTISINENQIAKYKGDKALNVFLSTNGELKAQEILTQLQVKRIAAECCNTAIELMEVKNRNEYAVWARYLCFYYFKEYAKYSLADAGAIFDSPKKHCSVLHGLKKLSGRTENVTGWRLKAKEEFLTTVEDLHRELNDLTTQDTPNSETEKSEAS